MRGRSSFRVDGGRAIQRNGSRPSRRPSRRTGSCRTGSCAAVSFQLSIKEPSNEALKEGPSAVPLTVLALGQRLVSYLAMNRPDHRRTRSASPRRSRAYRRLAAVVLVGVAGYLVLSRARPFAPGLLRRDGATAPAFTPMPQGTGTVRGLPPPPFPRGRMPGRPFPPGPRGADLAPPSLLHGGQTVAVVDLNTAQLADLQTLPGITPDYARKILAGRPYRSFRDVVEHTGIPQQVVDQISPPAMIRVFEGRSSQDPEAPSAPQRNRQP
jgi:Helix-hairpin-helix motif